MSQFKVVDTDNTRFKVGEIVTRCEEDSFEFRQYIQLAELFGMTKNPFFNLSAPYKNEAGLVQALGNWQVVPL